MKNDTWAPAADTRAGVLPLLAMVGLSVAISGCCGVDRYLANAKRSEATNATGSIARGIKACAEQAKALPPSSTRVPAALSDVKGKKYQSSAADWASPTWKCAKYSMNEPQYFQYHWELASTTKGTVRAEADLSGGGKADTTVEVDVICTAPGVCDVSAPRVH